MTPPAAAAAPRTRTRPATSPPRRVSGPARGKARTASAVASPPPLALRLGGAMHGLAEHHFLDRIIRGRAWIGILAVGLIGIVFMQVSMLRLNAGIGQAVEKAGTLERQNAAISATISELSSGDRIAAEAIELGLVLPAVTPRFLDARGADGRRAVATITAPGVDMVPSTLVTAPVDPAVIGTTPVLAQTGVAPAPETASTTETTAVPVAQDATATSDPAATTTTTDSTATTTDTAATTTPTTDQAAFTQTAAPPPADTGGVDASGQIG